MNRNRSLHTIGLSLLLAAAPAGKMFFICASTTPVKKTNAI